MYSQFRVDKNDADEARILLDKFCQKYEGKYLFAIEKGKETAKLHLQGWCCHTAPDNTYRKHWAKAYADLGTHSKCFTKVKDRSTYIAYIISNDCKGHLSYDDVVTNYTEEEFNRLKSEPPFIDLKTKEVGKKQSFSNEVLETFVKHGVKEGLIMYHLLPTLYLRHCPKRINKNIMYDNVLALTVQLEQRFPREENFRAQKQLVSSFGDIDCANGTVFGANLVKKDYAEHKKIIEDIK